MDWDGTIGSFNTRPDLRNKSMTVPAGTYHVSFFKIEKKISKKTGEPFMNCWFKILSGIYKGMIIFDVIPFEPRHYWKLGRHIRAINPNYVDGTPFNAFDYIGSELEMTIIYNDKDKKFPRITSSHPYVESGSVQPHTDEELFNDVENFMNTPSKLKASMSEIKDEDVVESSPAPTIKDEDIPF
jgi:hypothetical protein